MMYYFCVHNRLYHLLCDLIFSPSMKAATSQLLLIVLIISGLHAAKIMHSASIKGVVMQDEQIKNIWAVQGNDSTVVTMEDGYFKIPVKPGMWKIIIESKDKY